MNRSASARRYSASGIVGKSLVRSLFSTVHFRITGERHLRPFRDSGRPVIFAFWHGRLLPLVHRHRDQRAVVLVSEHGDGEYITSVLERCGFGTVRGSSTRGGVRGLKGLVRAARQGHDLAVTPDGPRGPNRKVKPGVLAVARMTGLPLIPIGVGASAGWQAESWDRFLVPRPFSTVRIAYGRPHWVDRHAEARDLEASAGALARSLEELSRLAGDSAGS